MRITITKGERADLIDAARGDGSVVRTTFPHKGPIPHDAVHFYVESVLGLRDAFWGMVAAGRHPEEIAAIAKAAGHASAKRAAIPDDAVVRLVQAERVVECFEADLWSGQGNSPEIIRDSIAAGCAQSCVPPPAVSDDAIADIRSRLSDLRRCWSDMAAGQTVVLEWELASA